MSERVAAMFSLLLATAIPLAGCVRAGSSRPGGSEVHRHEDASFQTEREAYELARPVFEKYCAACHTTATGSAAALEHFSMDGYPFAGHHSDDIGAAIRAALGAAGGSPTMPKGRPGIVRGDELRLVLDWADAFDRKHTGGAVPDDHSHGSTEDEHHDH